VVAPQDTIVSGNHVTSKLGDGILVDNGATGTLLIRNLAIGSGDDGIDVDAGHDRDPQRRQSQSRPRHRSGPRCH
jgi:hypothetical protein